MEQPAADGEEILLERLPDVDRGALARAVAVVVQRGDGDDNFAIGCVFGELVHSHPTNRVRVTPAGKPPSSTSTV